MKAIAKKALIGTIGGLALLAGVAMIVLPGPAVIVIPAGLAILATQFAWAQRLLNKTRYKFKQVRDRYRQRREPKVAQR